MPATLALSWATWNRNEFLLNSAYFFSPSCLPPLNQKQNKIHNTVTTESHESFPRSPPLPWEASPQGSIGREGVSLPIWGEQWESSSPHAEQGRPLSASLLACCCCFPDSPSHKQALKKLSKQILLVLKTRAILFWMPPHTEIRYLSYGLPRWSSNKESACECRRLKRHRFSPWVGKIPWRRKWQPTPVFLPGEFHGQRSLAGYSPWGCKVHGEMTEHTHTHLSYNTVSSILIANLEVRY